jgi:monooxygenase
VKYVVDGQVIEPGKLIIYRGLLYSKFPNLVYFTGYFNAS